MEIYEVTGDKRQYMDLLLLADESPSMIERYIDTLIRTFAFQRVRENNQFGVNIK